MLVGPVIRNSVLVPLQHQHLLRFENLAAGPGRIARQWINMSCSRSANSSGSPIRIHRKQLPECLRRREHVVQREALRQNAAAPALSQQLPLEFVAALNFLPGWIG